MEEVKTTMESMENPIIKDDEIDLIEVAKTIWAGRKLILKVTAVFFVIGLVIAFGSKVEYEASCKLMPESQEGMKPNLGGLGSLAGLAGINLDMGSNGSLTPELYPQILQSTPFLMKIWDEPIRFDQLDTTYSVYVFFNEVNRPNILDFIINYTVRLPSKFKSLFSPADDEFEAINGDKMKILRLSKDDTKLLKRLKKRISVEVDPKSGIISLTTYMPDALASAELAQLSIDLLTRYVTDYKIVKAKENYNFILARYDEAKIDFITSQEKLALFNDRNRNVVTALANAESQRLQNEYNLAFDVYKGLSTQLEQAKIKLKLETPIFTVLEPVRVPVYKYSPRKTLIISISLFLGLCVGIIIMIVKHFLNNF